MEEPMYVFLGMQGRNNEIWILDMALRSVAAHELYLLSHDMRVSAVFCNSVKSCEHGGRYLRLAMPLLINGRRFANFPQLGHRIGVFVERTTTSLYLYELLTLKAVTRLVSGLRLRSDVQDLRYINYSNLS